MGDSSDVHVIRPCIRIASARNSGKLDGAVRWNRERFERLWRSGGREGWGLQRCIVGFPSTESSGTTPSLVQVKRVIFELYNTCNCTLGWSTNEEEEEAVVITGQRMMKDETTRCVEYGTVG